MKPIVKLMMKAAVSRSFCSSNIRKTSSRRVVGLFGLCEDRNSSFMKGAAAAPKYIREQLTSPSSNSSTEMGKCINNLYFDYGDITPVSNDSKSIMTALSPVIQGIGDRNELPLIMGGDHSITYSICKSLSLHQRPFKIVHFDAHPDVYENFEGNRDSHASPFARIWEDGGICSGLLSIGLRTINAHQQEQIARYGTRVVEAKDVPYTPREMGELLRGFIAPGDRVYVSIDLDVLDPAFAPGDTPWCYNCTFIYVVFVYMCQMNFSLLLLLCDCRGFSPGARGTVDPAADILPARHARGADRSGCGGVQPGPGSGRGHCHGGRKDRQGTYWQDECVMELMNL